MQILADTLPPLRAVGILPGTFNPPTRAHVALARAALAVVDAVVFVLPRSLPHKDFAGGASFDLRVEMLRRVAASDQRFAAAISDGGLFIDIAREVREICPAAEVYFICGRDAAERIVTWDYGEPGAIHRMLREFRVLVAPRDGIYTPPEDLRDSIEFLNTQPFDECSSTAARGRIATRSGNWRELVPEEIAELVESVYASP